MNRRNFSKKFMVFFPDAERYACWDDLVDDHDHDGQEFYQVHTFNEASKCCRNHMDRMYDLGAKVPTMQVVGINHTGVTISIEDIL